MKKAYKKKKTIKCYIEKEKKKKEKKKRIPEKPNDYWPICF